MTTTSERVTVSDEVSPIIVNPLFTLGIPTWGAMVEIQRTMLATFLARAAATPDAPFIGRRHPPAADFTFQTYAEVHARVRRLCRGMRHALGVTPGTHVAVVAAAVPEYLVLCLAAFALRCVVVPVSENSAPDVAEYVLHHSEAVVAFVSERVAAGKMLDLVRTLLPPPRTISIESGLAELEQGGGEDAVWPEPGPAMDDLALVVYTSGTTARFPKGVMLTHANLTHGVGALVSNIPPRLQDRSWRYYNFLPLSHVYGMALCFVVVRLGGAIGFFSGDRRELLDEIRALRPTLIACVPRVLAKFYEAINAKLAGSSAVVRMAFNAAYALKRRAIMRC
jgi:long-chain acyl-CoA synthetase